jgi:Bcr/CflA subfamily drug resistance transporter
MVVLAWMLILYGLLAGLSNDIYLPGMPMMVEYFDTSEGMIQLTLTAWVVGVASLQVFMGPWSDHYGRRPTFIIGGLLFLIGSLLCAYAPNVALLLAGRVLQGIGVCSIMVITFAAMKEVFDVENRLKWLVYYNMTKSLAPLLGPVIGGYVLLFFSWRANFVLIFILGVLSYIALLRLLPETKPSVPVGEKREFNLSSIAQQYGLALRDKALMRFLMTYFGIFAGIMVYLTAGAFILIERLGLSEQMFAYTQVAVSGAYILGAYFTKYMHNRLGLNRIIMLGIFAVLLGTASMALFNLWQENVWFVIMPVAVFSLGFGMSSAPLNDKVLAHEHFAGGILGGMIGLTMSVSGLLGTLAASVTPTNASVTGALMLVFALFSLWAYKWY